MTDNTDHNNQQEIMKKTFQNILLQIGKKISSQFLVDANTVAPDEQGNISDTIKPIMKVAKDMFKGLLGQNFNSEQLSSLGTMVNKTFLDNMNSDQPHHQSPIALAIQLLMNIGIPMVKNIIDKVSHHSKKVEQKEQHAVTSKAVGYHASNRETKNTSQHAQLGHEVGAAAFHRKMGTQR
jgi:hypothetical protein